MLLYSSHRELYCFISYLNIKTIKNRNIYGFMWIYIFIINNKIMNGIIFIIVNLT